jgi:hypothetical protein
MPNPIKYSTSAQTLALKKGNFWIGTGDVGKGPTSVTDYYNGITPPAGGYTIYLNKASGGPSIYTAANDSQLISLSNTISGQTFATAAALDWFATQTDKMVFNIDCPAIITNGLILNLDAGFTPSYPTTGTTWYDLSSGGNNGTLTNGPTFNSANGGSIVFDGVDDYISIVGVNSLFEVANATFTVNMWVYAYAIQNRMGLWGKNDAYEFGFISSGSILFWSPGGTVSVAIVDSNYLNQWKMITSINSPQGSYVYSNGVLIGYGGQLSGVGGSSFAIGSGFDPPGTNTFNGRIGITQIYNRALTETEILLNYNAQKSRFGL